MSKIAEEALLAPKGISTRFATKGEALNFRQRFYSARNAQYKREKTADLPNIMNDLPLMRCEVMLREAEGGWDLIFRAQNSAIPDMHFQDIATGEAVQVEGVETEFESEAWTAIMAELDAKEGRIDMSDTKQLDARIEKINTLYANGYRVKKKEESVDLGLTIA